MSVISVIFFFFQKIYVEIFGLYYENKEKFYANGKEYKWK